MDTQLKRYARKLVEEQLGQSRLQLAQIADDISFITTQQDKKFSEPQPFAAKPFLTRFKILICGVHPVDVDTESLPWAYPQFTTSGLRGESLGIPILPRGTFVYVSKDMQTGEYFIERIAPNMSPDLPLMAGSPYGAVSGLDPKSAGQEGTEASDLITGNSRVLGNEIFNFSGPSLADMMQNSPREEAKWQFPTLDAAKNTVGGMSSAIENSIKDVERLKRGLIGGNNVFRQSLATIGNAEKSVEAISQALGKQVKLISGYLNNVMKKAQKKVLRMINQMMNQVTAQQPLSGKFANTNLINKAIKAASCAFNLSISAMPKMVGQGLMGIIDKAVNTSACLIENFVSNFVGQIVGQLSALIEGAMGTIGNVLQGGMDVLGSIGDVLGSIMNMLNCEVTPKAGDPVVKEWNLLDGANPVKITLNTDNIFEKAKKVGQKFKEATKVPDNINKYKFKFDPGDVAQQTMDQCGGFPTLGGGGAAGAGGGGAAGAGGGGAAGGVPDPMITTAPPGAGGAYGGSGAPSGSGVISSQPYGVLGPIQCGPPSVTFWGGKGSGAVGNPVISTAEENFGQLMGVDIIKTGNYTKAPFVHVLDECGGGRGAVLQSVLGPVDPSGGDNFDFIGDIEVNSNEVRNFELLDLARVDNKEDLVGTQISLVLDDFSIPEGTKITRVGIGTLFLNNEIGMGERDYMGGSLVHIGAGFKIVGYDPVTTAGITTFDVAVKNRELPNNTLSSKFTVNDGSGDIMRQQRTLTLQRGKTYKFDQSSPSNGLVLSVGTDELELIKGEETYEIDTFWYDEVNIHPLRFSEKSDGIHNCDVTTTVDDPDEWLLAKDGLAPDDWVLTSLDQGWSPFLQNYGRYPAYAVLPGVHEGNWEVDVKEPGTYTFEVQADNKGTITLDGIYIGATDPIPYLQIESIVETESVSSEHTIVYEDLATDGRRLATSTLLEFDDNAANGFDVNGEFSIESGEAVFTDDGRSITGSGPVSLKYKWKDIKSISGKSLESITIGDIKWVQTDRTRGEVTQTVILRDRNVINEVRVYESHLDLKNGPHRVPKYLEVEINTIGTHVITASIENSRRGTEGAERDWHNNPGALAWVLRKGTGGEGTVIASSNDPFITKTTVTRTNCGVEYADGVEKNDGEKYTDTGVTKSGIEPGKPNSYIEIVVTDNTPDKLYYYCENHANMGGEINIIGGETDVNMGCRNATVVIDDVDENGSVIALRDLRGGTGYREGSTNLITSGGNGTSLTIDVIKATEEGTITSLRVNNGGKGYASGNVVTPLCNFGERVPRQTGIGVTQVIVKETGWGYKPWPNGDWGGMERTWADRCQSFVHRANGDWDTPYSYGQVATLYFGDCITFPSQEVICIDDNFKESDIPGAQLIEERVIPKYMGNIDFGGDQGEISIFEDATLISTEYIENITYVERIEGTEKGYEAGIAQWWFYVGETNVATGITNSVYKGTFIQDTLSDIPQIVEPMDDGDELIYRIAKYQENVNTSVIIDPDEWMNVANELRRVRPDAWVITDPQGWSPFLQNYGVFPGVDLGHGPGEFKELADSPQTGTWSVYIDEPGIYYFEVQADNQGSITFDGVYLGSTTVFRSHNDSIFFEVNNVTEGSHTIQGTILNVSHPSGKKGWENNPAALAWVMRKGETPDRRLVVETSTVLRERENQDHEIVYTGLKVAGDVRWATPSLLEFDDNSANGFDINATLEIISGEAVFVRNANGTCNTIKGTGDIKLRYDWNDRPKTSGQVLDFFTIEGVEWDQLRTKTGFAEHVVTLVDEIITEEVEVRNESYVTVGEQGEIVRSSLDPFENETEMVESATRTLFGVETWGSDAGRRRREGPIFTCEDGYKYAKSLGFSDCDIRNFLETSGMAVDQCMQDKLDDDEWGRCADFKVLVTAPDCPEKTTRPCPEGFYFEDGICKPDNCPPGEHRENGVCVPDECPPGQHKVNGVCVDREGCPPGQHEENGICVPDDCPDGYYRDPQDITKCIRIPTTTCPPSDTYRVISCLESIIVANPGFGYNCCDDTVVIEPANGAEAVIESCDGGILSIRVTKCGAGFRELPKVYINTETGLNAFLIAVLKFHREDFDEFPEGTVVTQVVDCIGNVGSNARTRVT